MSYFFFLGKQRFINFLNYTYTILYIIHTHTHTSFSTILAKVLRKKKQLKWKHLEIGKHKLNQMKSLNMK